MMGIMKMMSLIIVIIMIDDRDHDVGNHDNSDQ